MAADDDSLPSDGSLCAQVCERLEEWVLTLACSVETFWAVGALGRHPGSGCEVIDARDDEVGGEGCA
jgi:hypothetical protein